MEKELENQTFKIGRATVERLSRRGPKGNNSRWGATIQRKGKVKSILEGCWHGDEKRFLAPYSRNNLLTKKIIEFIYSFENLKG